MSEKLPSLWTPEEMLYKERMAIGEAFLKQIVETDDLVSAGDEAFTASDNPNVRSFVASLIDDIVEIESMDSLTRRGVAHYLMHGNRLLGDISPLEAAVVDRHDLVKEAAHCFYDTERAFDPELAETVEETASKARQYIAQT